MRCARLGFLPGLAYTVIFTMGAVLGIRGPVVLLVDLLVGSVWSAPVFYFLVIGGSALSVMVALSLADERWAFGRLTRISGWSGFVLLLINVPLLLFQMHFALLDD